MSFLKKTFKTLLPASLLFAYCFDPISVKAIDCPTDSNLLFGNSVEIIDSDEYTEEVFEFKFTVNSVLADEQEYITVGFGDLSCYAVVLFPSEDVEYIDPRMKSVESDEGELCENEWHVFTVKLPMKNMYECGFVQTTDQVENKVTYSNELLMITGKTDTVQYFDVDVYTFETKKVDLSIIYPMSVQSVLSDITIYGEHLEFSYVSSLIDMTSLPPSMVLWIKTFTQHPYKVYNGTLYNENMTEIGNSNVNILISGNCDDTTDGEACEQTSTNIELLTPPLCGTNSKKYTYEMYFTCSHHAEDVACNSGDMSFGYVEFLVNPSPCNEESTATTSAVLNAYKNLELGDDNAYDAFVFGDTVYLTMFIQGLSGGDVVLDTIEVARDCSSETDPESRTPSCVDTYFTIPIQGYQEPESVYEENPVEGYATVWKQFGSNDELVGEGDDDYEDSIVFSITVNDYFFPLIPDDNLPGEYTITSTAVLNGFERRRLRTQASALSACGVVDTPRRLDSSNTASKSIVITVEDGEDSTTVIECEKSSNSSKSSSINAFSIAIFVVGCVFIVISLVLLFWIHRLSVVASAE